MTKRLLIVWTLALFFLPVTVFAQDYPKAKNVIIMIGDGMGFNSDLAGTYYRYGEAERQSYHSFPVRLGCTTYSQAKADKPIPADCKGYDPEVFWQSPSGNHKGTEFTVTTDSAASSTAIHSGVKTINRKIGVDAQNKPVELLSEVAVKTGRKAGCVTTVSISHATPAGFAAHSQSRGDQDEIFNQMSGKKSSLTVMMGCGHPLYVHGKERLPMPNESENDRKSRFLKIGGESTWEKMQSGVLNGFTIIDTKKQFAELASPQPNTMLPQKVIGLVRCWSIIPPVDGILEDIAATQDVYHMAITRNSYEAEFAVKMVDEIPDLTTMSLGAINILDRANDRGFVLMIEGGMIDGANHLQNIGHSVLEHTGFTKAVDAVVQWVEMKSSWDETLVIITADHETGQIWGPDTYRDSNGNGVFDKDDEFNGFQSIENTGRGNLPKVQYGSKGHTNALVPLYAKGPGAELFLQRIKGTDTKAATRWKFSGQYIDNTDIVPVVKTVLTP